LLFETFVIPGTYSLYINCDSTTIYLHIDWKVHVACNFSFYCQKWRSFQGHRQSHSLRKW